MSGNRRLQFSGVTYPHRDSVRTRQATVHADDSSRRCAKEVEVAQHGRLSPKDIVPLYAEANTVDITAEFGPQGRELMGQRRNFELATRHRGRHESRLEALERIASEEVDPPRPT